MNDDDYKNIAGVIARRKVEARELQASSESGAFDIVILTINDIQNRLADAFIAKDDNFNHEQFKLWCHVDGLEGMRYAEQREVERVKRVEQKNNSIEGLLK